VAPLPEAIHRPGAISNELTPDSVLREEESGVIVDGRTPVDLTRKSNNRDQKALTVVLLITVVMVLVAGLAALLLILR